MSSSTIRHFNTHEISDAAILASVTGHEEERKHIIGEIKANIKLKKGQLQHLLIRAPRGFGKSFMTRLAEIDTNDLAKKGEQVQFALLPEEQRNVKRPQELLKEINRTLKGLPWNQVTPVWDENDEYAWEEAVAELDQTIGEIFSTKQGLIVVALENFDTLLSSVFKTEERQVKLRKWMTGNHNQVMLLATTTDAVNLDYEMPIFQAFQEIILKPWTEDECIDYFNRLQHFNNEAVLDKDQEAKARAIANFIGGNPRLARLLGNVIKTQDALSVTETLDTLVDEFSDYYRRRIDDLGEKAQILIDTLIRNGEPRSQSEIAELAGTTQSRIARAFAELQRSQLVIGLRATNSRETLYRVTDRVFVHFYRTRYGGMSHESSPLNTIMDFLESFFSRHEASDEAERMFEQGNISDGRIFSDIAWSKAGGGLKYSLQEYQRNFKRNFERYLKAVEISKDNQLWEVIEQFNSSPEKVFQTSEDLLSQSLTAKQEVLWLVIKAYATIKLSLSDEKTKVLLDRAVDIADSAPGLLCIAYRERGLFYYYVFGNREQAFKDFEFSGSQADKMTQTYLAVTALNDKALSLIFITKYKEAIEIANKAIELAKQLNDKVGQTKALQYKVFGLRRMNRHKEVIEPANKFLELAKQIDDKHGQAIGLSCLAWNLGKSKRYKEAIEIANKVMELAELIDEKLLQAESRRLVAWSLWELERYKEAIEILQKSLILAKEINDNFELSRIIALLLRFSRYGDLTDCVGLFSQWLKLSKDRAEKDIVKPQISVGDLFAATTSARQWIVLLELMTNQASWFKDVEKSWYLNEPGIVLAEIAKTQGRAEAYATAVSMIEAISKSFSVENQKEQLGINLKDLVSATIKEIGQKSDHFGFMEDFISLIDNTFGIDQFENEIDLLKAAANYHKSSRDPATLERVDPDIATAIKRVWDKK